MAHVRTSKDLIAAGVAACCALWLTTAAHAAPPAGTGTTTSIAAINSAIDFGSFAVLSSCINCSVTISPSGARTSSGGIVLTSANPGRAASYSVTEGGCSCKAYTEAMTPTSVPQVTGGVQMTVGSFTSVQSAALPPNTFTVGATLTIAGPGATAGTYSGWSFTVTTSP